MININGLNALIIAGNILLWPMAIAFVLVVTTALVKALVDAFKDTERGGHA